MTKDRGKWSNESECFFAVSMLLLLQISSCRWICCRVFFSLLMVNACLFSFAILILCYCRAHLLSTTFAHVALTICKLHICIKAFIAVLFRRKSMFSLSLNFTANGLPVAGKFTLSKWPKRSRGIYTSNLNREPNGKSKKKSGSKEVRQGTGTNFYLWEQN